MGEIYADVVVSCLTCLDSGNPIFGDVKEFTDSDDIVVGVRYIERVSSETSQMWMFRS